LGLCLIFVLASDLETAKASSHDAASYVQSGNEKHDRGDLDGAITDYTRAIDLNPKYANAYHNRGRVKHAKGDLDGALADFTSALALAPKHALAYYNRGNAKYAKGALDGALADYSRALALDPKYTDAYHNRGLAKAHKGDLDGAIADYSRAIDIDPKYAAAYRSRGYTRYNQRSWTDALVDLRKASELDPSGDYTRFYLWLIRTRLGERQAATVELKQYLAQRKTKNPDDWPSKIGAFLTDQLSEEIFLKAVESKDQQVTKAQRCEAYFYAGSVRLLAGDKETARRYFERAVETAEKTRQAYDSAAAELKFLK
jgi:lipoprotein NlpI